jgi:hypothetical protein
MLTLRFFLVSFSLLWVEAKGGVDQWPASSLGILEECTLLLLPDDPNNQ